MGLCTNYVMRDIPKNLTNLSNKPVKFYQLSFMWYGLIDYNLVREIIYIMYCLIVHVNYLVHGIVIKI